jgi:flagellar biosynthetic protein FliQ
MTQVQALSLVQQCLWLAIQIVTPALLAGLAVGSLISVFQAATQIQEQSLSFVPKIAALLGTLALTGGWMLTKLVDYSRQVMLSLPDLMR